MKLTFKFLCMVLRIIVFEMTKLRFIISKSLFKIQYDFNFGS